MRDVLLSEHGRVEQARRAGEWVVNAGWRVVIAWNEAVGDDGGEEGRWRWRAKRESVCVY